MKFKLWIEGQGVPGLALRMDVSPSTVYRWLNGETTPKHDHCLKIMKISKGAVTYKDILECR